MSRAERAARRHGLNVNSETSQQVLRNLDTKVKDFVARLRKGSINRELPSEVKEMTIEQALDHSSKVRKLLINSEYVK
jgi:hypothetical protein